MRYLEKSPPDDLYRRLHLMTAGETPEITVENRCGLVLVQFGGVTHINFRLSEYLGFQSWRGSDTHFFLEVELRGGRIHAEYDNIEKWKSVIAGIDRAVAQ